MGIMGIFLVVENAGFLSSTVSRSLLSRISHLSPGVPWRALHTLKPGVEWTLKIRPRGSEYPNSKVLSLKTHTLNGFWTLKPYYLGTWTLRELHEGALRVLQFFQVQLTAHKPLK